MDALNPEVILRYAGVKVGDETVTAETTPEGNIKFRSAKTNYTGQREYDLEVIYVK